MRLTSIELPGFGCLSGFRSELGPALNLFYGDNEAGKSTLQQAICAMLYGFYDNDRARPDETARHDRLRPWPTNSSTPGVFRGAMAYELDDGRRFEVRRDFSTTDVLTQLIDAELGTDASGQFGRGRHGNIPFARKQLGMPRTVFESCAFISQGEIFELAKNAPTEIGDAIAALADSARRDVSAVKAIAALETAAGKIGSDRARTADLPVARDNLRRAKEELTAADQARHSLAEKASRLEALQAKGRQLAEQAAHAERAAQLAEVIRLRDQLRRLDEAEAILSRATARVTELAPYAGPSLATLRDQVMALRGQIQSMLKSLAKYQTQREPLATELTDDTRFEYETLRQSAGALTEPHIRALEAIAYARPDTESVGMGPSPDPRGLLATVPRFLRAIARTIGRGIGAILRLVGAPLAAPTGAGRRDVGQSTPVGAPLAAPTGAGPGDAGQTTPAPLAAPNGVGIPQPDAIALLEKHRRYLTLRPLIEEGARLDTQIEADTMAADALKAQLRSVLRAAGVDSERLTDALAAFEDLCQKRADHQASETAAAEAERRRDLLLAGHTRAELAESLAEREAHMVGIAQAPVGQGPRPDTDRRSPEQLARTAQSARQQQHLAEVEATRLEEEVRLTLDRFRPRAEIEEEIAHWGAEVSRLEKARAALQLARATIEEAMTSVYRDFAPAVNTFLSEGIEAATDGRYHRAHVDPSTLRVSLLVPETGQVVTDPPVSHGTRTLLYVLMRIGLAQHMSAIGEPVPLILDDPFVDVDSRRLRRMLDFLLALSERMQIILFTKDREVLAWFQENAAEPANRLNIMSGALAATSL